jgi:hypothetical protein
MIDHQSSVHNIVYNPTGSIASCAKFNNFLESYFESSGENVTLINCKEYLGKSCHVKENFKFDQNSYKLTHKVVCKICVHRQEVISQDSKSSILWINKNEIQEIEELIQSINQENYQEFRYNDVLFGINSAYDIILKYKLQNIDQIVNYWNEYMLSLKNSLKTYWEIISISTNLNAKRLFVYNSLYSTNRAAVEAANKLSIKCYTINKGYNVSERESSYIVTEALKHPLLIHSDNRWEKVKAELQEKSIDNHMKIKMFGVDSHNFSTRRKDMSLLNMFKKFGLNKYYKKICLVLVSSEDEYYATKLVGLYPEIGNEVFQSQIEWLDYVKKIAQDLDHVLFIIRMHPREFSNKRSSSISANIDVVTSNFTGREENVYINAPKDGVSVYDLILNSDLVLNMSSSLGAEVAYLKKPIIGFMSTRLVAYPKSIHKISNSSEEYREDVVRYLSLEKSEVVKITMNQRTQAIKWFKYLFEIAPIRFKKEENNVESLKRSNLPRYIPEAIKKVLNIILFLNEKKKFETPNDYSDNYLKLDLILGK